MEPELGFGLPTKGKVPLDDKGLTHSYGTIGVGFNKEGLRNPRLDKCNTRWMQVSVLAKRDMNHDEYVLLELGSYDFSTLGAKKL